MKLFLNNDFGSYFFNLFISFVYDRIDHYYSLQDQEDDVGSAVCDYLSYLSVDILHFLEEYDSRFDEFSCAFKQYLKGLK